ncbi:hypothetical protein ACFX12_013959 [Malus domestica]
MRHLRACSVISLCCPSNFLHATPSSSSLESRRNTANKLLLPPRRQAGYATGLQWLCSVAVQRVYSSCAQWLCSVAVQRVCNSCAQWLCSVTIVVERLLLHLRHGRCL